MCSQFVVHCNYQYYGTSTQIFSPPIADIYIYHTYVSTVWDPPPPPSVFCPDITCMFDSALSTATTHSKAAPVRKTAKALKLYETEESSKIHSK